MNIEQFCASDDIRHYLHKPLRTERGLVATNGHIAVLVADNGGEYENFSDHIKNTSAERLFSPHETVDKWLAASLVALPVPTPCDHCNGTGHTLWTDCDECDGEGYFDHGGHEYECKECDGEGRVKRVGGDHKEPCPWCDSTGNKLVPIPVGDQAHISSKYLAVLHGLPDCEISLGGTSAGIPFRFNGGIGVVMPMRA
ncbi:hypothetical protein PT7_P007 (plasmid) [Pusillimonas sp. T7-7]|uniref:hypothetical protein n=1 Tax=Pusillimonas sp. (strain T7-7) TaxID=1007105 RepID=UPI0002084A7E|nr:hypothetical protein [Pusillimonas sp. T7-7]AEC22243.1 hypothetical protein PT7_P007 [Pusillimonas sp. T7-7]